MLSAIDRLHLQRGTALGSGIVVALAAIFPEAGITLESVRDAASKRTARSNPIDEPQKAEVPFKRVPPVPTPPRRSFF
jgi:Ca-activated chloride channel family protein